ncbi:MAG: ATP-dependent helicase [Bellilinea sp.]
MVEPRLRPKQREVLAYPGGWMGVSAVPGSGKTYALSLLAANLITSGSVGEDQEVLIVTLVNSAVDNFTSRVGNFVEKSGLMRDLNYRVRTLHGLAHDIVRERPDLAGLSDRFNIADERDSQEIIQAAVAAWIRSHPEFLLEWTDERIDLHRNPQVMRQWEETLIKVAIAFIRQSKDLQLPPRLLRDRLGRFKFRSSLLNFGVEVYETYQRGLALRSLVDFDDLITLALQCLRADPDYLQRLRYRFPYILEDEAQDSSRLQEEILRLLAGENGNWVRVGDPNQAIYETFTTASPEYLRRFLTLNQVAARDLPDSGRSTASIIRLANELIRWSLQDHPIEELRGALTPPYIRHTDPNDPQPNPSDQPDEVILFPRKLSAEEELRTIIRSLRKWLPDNPDQTVAVLVPRNERGSKVVSALKDAGLPVLEILQSSQITRQTAAILQHILVSLNKPADTSRMVDVFRSYALLKFGEDGDSNTDLIEQAAKALERCSNPEEFLYPRPEADWLDRLVSAGQPVELIELLEQFGALLRRWQQAILLPVDQLILTISQDLFKDPAQLALTHSLALMLARAARSHPDWQLSQMAEELALIARNERRIIGFSDAEPGFDPEQHKGEIVVATIHRAKGLEWDRVYLMSVNNYDFPSAQPNDQYYPEKHFFRAQLNLEAETLSQLRAIAEEKLSALYLEEGIATREARLDYCAERLRLFYVGITRAKRSLIITWNTGKLKGGRENQRSLPFVHLQEFWEAHRGASEP